MILEITPHGANPAEQIRDRISGLITTGALARGDRLPSVRQLATDLEVAPGTVAKAYRALESDGLIVSRAGAGTRVSEDASSVSPAVARAARRLASTGRQDGLDLEEAVRVLRAMW
ncbi:GntR family transcriptional regulator [Brachybacterium fresconis]|uniref:DNA-binding transcriptional regulator YhcF (GntR family) n=1 Tax=Brachybacterium fresconis TaxID=173363 RepID=A0ABS4YNU7_9MICO|nr:GntR family transcriptional regulator [Brachybacterium fresconis]MBP2410466.1 DNA-binding transcriptional regulator YhcF (GntR family) [Brachybacterium fresconis]